MLSSYSFGATYNCKTPTSSNGYSTDFKTVFIIRDDKPSDVVVNIEYHNGGQIYHTKGIKKIYKGLKWVFAKEHMVGFYIFKQYDDHSFIVRYMKPNVDYLFSAVCAKNMDVI
jgi:hypothetical protein